MCLTLKHTYNAKTLNGEKNIYIPYIVLFLSIWFWGETRPGHVLDYRPWAGKGLTHAHAVCVSELYVITVAMHRTAEVCNWILTAVSAPVVSGSQQVQRSTVENHRVHTAGHVHCMNTDCTEAYYWLTISHVMLLSFFGTFELHKPK